MIDKPLLKRRFAAALPGYDAHAAVQNEICIRLDEMIGRIRILPVDRAMEIGAGTGFLTRLLLKRFPDAQWMLNDMIETTEEYLKPYAAGRNVAYMWGDAEQLPLPIGTDLLASASTVQWFDDVPAFMKKAADALVAGGMFAFTTFGPDNFREIRQTTGDGLSYYSCEELQQMLVGAGFSIAETLEYARVLMFDTPQEVLGHIRETGVNAVRRIGWQRPNLENFDSTYRTLFGADDGRVSLTYHPILIVAVKTE